MEFTIGEVAQIVKPGDVIIFPPDVPHSGRTFERACRIIDIFSPPRHGMKELIANANPMRPRDTDSWWRPDEDEPA